MRRIILCMMMVVVFVLSVVGYGYAADDNVLCILRNIDYQISDEKQIVEKNKGNVTITIDEYGDIVFITPDQQYWTANCFALLDILPYFDIFEDGQLRLHAITDENDITFQVGISKHEGIWCLGIFNQESALMLHPNDKNIGKMKQLNKKLRDLFIEGCNKDKQYSKIYSSNVIWAHTDNLFSKYGPLMVNFAN